MPNWTNSRSLLTAYNESWTRLASISSRRSPSLLGRPLTDFQIDRLIEYADILDTTRLDVIWKAQRDTPKRLAYRDYLAMTLRGGLWI